MRIPQPLVEMDEPAGDRNKAPIRRMKGRARMVIEPRTLGKDGEKMQTGQELKQTFVNRLERLF